MERELHLIYNPFILNVLLQKVAYFERIHCILVHDTGLDHERLIRENMYAELFVADVEKQIRHMNSETHVFDIYYANYEYILYRMFQIFRPSDVNLPVDACQFEGDLFFFELSFFEIITEESHKKVLFRLVKEYCQNHYIHNLINYETIATDRSRLLFHMKRDLEDIHMSKDTTDYFLNYTDHGDVIILLMYLLFMKEFIGMLSSNRLLLELQKDEDAIKKLDNEIVLLKNLHDHIGEQLEKEFKSYVLVLSHSDDMSLNRDMDAYCANLVDRDEVYYSMKEESGSGFFMKRKEVSHLRYIKLCINRHLYIYVTRRFIFDCSLRLLHEKSCMTTQKNTECQLCRYINHERKMTDFYNIVTTHHYYGCYYIQQKAPQKKNRYILYPFLESVFLNPVDAITSVIYKNAWQILKMFDRIYRNQHHNEKSPQLFHTIHIPTLINDIRLQYHALNGGPEMRHALTLKSIRNSHKINTRLEKWQRRLAIDVDIILLIIYVINLQQNDIEKYERSVSSTKHKSYTLSSNIKATLTEVYQIYTNVLCKAMQ